MKNLVIGIVFALFTITPVLAETDSQMPLLQKLTSMIRNNNNTQKTNQTNHEMPLLHWWRGPGATTRIDKLYDSKENVVCYLWHSSFTNASSGSISCIKIDSNKKEEQSNAYTQ